ncbi:50S ribosomal protein L36 [Candidatus Woesebacteria bacterium]|nr:50S ribosomal protein L36 [Candidatus Woesebacteria bacterium]
MRVLSSPMPRCPLCKGVVRKGTYYIICPRNPKHKQKQG